MIAYLKVQSDSFCTHSFVFSCSSCLNRMASVKIVEASIVCVANMDVTVLCRRLQILTFFLVFSSWGKIDLVQPVPGYRVFFASRMFISLPQNLLPQFDQFYNCFCSRSDLLRLSQLPCLCSDQDFIFFFLEFFARPTLSLLGRTLNDSFEIVMMLYQSS